MDNISTTTKAIEAFDNNDISSFEKNSKAIFNHFNVYPSRLEHEKNLYLTGTVYYYLEGSLRDLDDAHRVCFENACYCFSQVISSEKIVEHIERKPIRERKRKKENAGEAITETVNIHGIETQGAAIRLFLLLHDNGIVSYNLFYNILVEYCPQMHGKNLERYLFGLNNDKAAIRMEVREQLKRVKSYCYSMFVGQNDNASVSLDEMNRLKSIITQEDYKEKPPIFYEHGGKYYFQEYFCKYLISEIRMEKGMRASRMSPI